MHKKIMKAISILIIVLLITTVLSSSGSASYFEFGKRKPKERIKNFVNNLIDVEKKEKNFGIKDQINNLSSLKILENSNTFQSNDKILNFYTNYNGIEKETRLRLFIQNKIDLDGKNGKDIGVRLTVLPSIAKPRSLSLDFKLTINQLYGFNQLDKDAFFEAYTDIYFPKLFFKNLSVDRVRYGYQSPKGESIPEKCDVIFKFIPNLFSLRRKAGFNFALNPDDQTIGEEKISLLFSLTEFEGDVVISEINAKTLYDPAVETEISIDRTRSLSKSVFKFERDHSDDSNVDMRLEIIEESNLTYTYVNNLPKLLTLIYKRGRSGGIEFNSHGDSIDEVGICDDFENPTYKVYFTNLASKAGFNWSRDRFLFLKKGKADFSAYSEGEDVGFHVYLKGSGNGFIDFEAFSHNPLDFSFYLDFSEKYIRIDRSDVDLTLSFYGEIVNQTVLSIINGGLQLKRTFDGPFEISFDELNNGILSIKLAGKNLQISDFNFDIESPTNGGIFSLACEELTKTNQGNISVDVSIQNQNENITGNCSIDIEHGVNIKDLLLKFNEITIYQGDLEVLGSVTRWYNFTVDLAIEWHVGKDGGYVLIKGGSYSSFSFNSLYHDENHELYGLVSGYISFKFLNDAFNISWKKIDGNLSFSLDGSAVAELKNFHFWLKDKADISISHISGKFQLSTDGLTKSGNLVLDVDSNPAILDVNIQNFEIGDNYNFTLQFSIDIDFSGSASGTVEVSWNESGITSLNTDFTGSGEGALEITDLLFIGAKGLVEISIDRISVVGDLNINLVMTGNDVTFTTTSGMTEIDVYEANFMISLYVFYLDTSISFNGSASINFQYLNQSGNVSLIFDATMSGTSEITINSLWMYISIMYIELNIDSLIINGPTTLNVAANMSEAIPVTLTIITQDPLTVGSAFVGYQDIIQIFVTDIAMDTYDGSLTVGLEMATFLPYVKIDNSKIEITSIILNMGGSPMSLENLTISGSAYLIGFLDISYFSYVYLKGEIIEDTKISLNEQNTSLVFEPGKFHLMLQQNFVFGLKYSYFNLDVHSSSWVSLESENKEYVKFKGTGHFRLDSYTREDGGKSFVINAKELAGAVVIPDAFRAAGEFDALIKISYDEFSNEDGKLTISGLNVSTEGSLSGLIQIKDNNSDWVTVYPFSSSGDVIVFPYNSAGMSIVTGPIYTLTDSATVRIEAWYAPPITFDGSDVSPYTYTINFGDGDSYQVTTQDTYVAINHDYDIGEYVITAKVETSSSSIPIVEDENMVKVVKGGYVGIESIGKTKFSYEDISNDGKIHTWCIVKNNADASTTYNLDWKIFSLGLAPEWNQWFFDPDSGTLEPQKTARINISFYPPLNGEEYVDYIVINNSNYPSYNPEEGIEDSNFFEVQMINSINILPSGPIFLPNIEPGDTISSSFWLRNDGKDSLNWEITDYPMNGSWSFSATSGVIKKGGSDIVRFSVTVPNEYNVDIGGIIRVVDSNDPSSEETVLVKGSTISNNTQNQSEAEVTVDGNNVSVKIGGKNEITLDDFTFDVNGLSGKVTGHFVFDVASSYVYVNWTQGDIASLSVDGAADFTIENFAFCLGDDVNIYVSQIITGGIHWHEGRSGNFSLMVDGSFIDIDVSINHSSSQFAISGRIDADILTSTDGNIWINWDLNNDTKEISIDGNLLRNAQMDIDIIDLKLELNNFSFSAERISFDRAVLMSFSNNNLELESETNIEIVGISFEINGGMSITGLSANIEIDGYVKFSIEPWGDGYDFCVDSPGFTIQGEIHIDYNGFTGIFDISFTGYWCIGLELG